MGPCQDILLGNQGFCYTSCVAICPENIFNIVYFLVKFLRTAMEILWRLWTQRKDYHKITVSHVHSSSVMFFLWVLYKYKGLSSLKNY